MFLKKLARLMSTGIVRSSPTSSPYPDEEQDRYFEPEKTCRDEKYVHAVQKLRREVEKVKQSLSTAHQVRMEVEPRFKEREFSETPTRAKFVELNMEMLEGTFDPIQQVHEDADLAKREIDEIVPVGSPTNIPKDQSHFGGYSRGRTQERRGEMGDNMRCLYTKVTMPRSVHRGEQCRAEIGMCVERGDGCDASVPAKYI